MRTHGWAGIVVALFSVAGCSGVVVDDPPPPRHSYFSGDFEYATHKGAIVTEVIGNPFGGPDDAFRNEIRRLMYGRNRGRTAQFVGAPSDQTVAPFRVVAAFNMPRNVDGHALCRGAANLPPPALDRALVNLAMAFCNGDALKSDASGYVTNVSGPNDPRFIKLVHGVTEAMLPTGDGMDMFGDGGGSVP